MKSVEHDIYLYIKLSIDYDGRDTIHNNFYVTLYHLLILHRIKNIV
jgi:hypothetical protein